MCATEQNSRKHLYKKQVEDEEQVVLKKHGAEQLKQIDNSLACNEVS